jgi:hypothetical protein
MKISEQLREGAREMTPAVKQKVKNIQGRLDLVTQRVKEAKAALDKWQKDKRFDPQQDNLIQSCREIKQLGAALASLSQKLE